MRFPMIGDRIEDIQGREFEVRGIEITDAYDPEKPEDRSLLITLKETEDES